MKLLILFFLITLPCYIFCQAFPSDAKVISDVKKYHGKVATAAVKNDWKLEKEAGYQFSNMAKRVVSATTIKENGVSKKIIGLAIYTRGEVENPGIFQDFLLTVVRRLESPSFRRCDP
ncbi:MAG: hypothetical protein IPF67_16390 [Saprospiraceae bacterium]|nr:hypothetical protein [Candidatus Brachybacter algidus]